MELNCKVHGRNKKWIMSIIDDDVRGKLVEIRKKTGKDENPYTDFRFYILHLLSSLLEYQCLI